MLLKWRLLMLLMFCVLPAAAQDGEFPTLQELIGLEVPGYDYADMVRRISAIDISHTPPSSPPTYQIGDVKVFMAPIDNTFYNYGPIRMVLRGISENVLVWIDEKERLSASRTQWLAEEIDRTIVQPMWDLLGYAEPPGIDGDARLYLVAVRQPDSGFAGIFAKYHAMPRSAYVDSNEHEMMVVNLSNHDKSDVFDPFFIATIAHEYQHVLTHHRDPDEVALGGRGAVHRHCALPLWIRIHQLFRAGILECAAHWIDTIQSGRRRPSALWRSCAVSSLSRRAIWQRYPAAVACGARRWLARRGQGLA